MRIFRSMARVAFVCLLVLALTPTIQAWGKIGHQAIGNLAWRLLDDDTQTKISSILSGTYGKDPNCSKCSPLGQVADWADIVRYWKGYHWSTLLHFVDIRDDLIPGSCPVSSNSTCGFVYLRDCPNNVCVAGAIVNYTSQTRAPGDLRSVAPQEREALMFLTHFVGDIHQPLHVARKTDLGGNTIHVTLWEISSDTLSMKDRGLRGVPRRVGKKYRINNLHAVWDDGFIDRYLKEQGALYAGKNARVQLEDTLWELVDTTRKTNATKWQAWTECGDGALVNCTTDWATESWEHALLWAYRNANGNEVQAGEHLSDLYYETRIAIVLERLATAGVRLASTLSNNL